MCGIVGIIGKSDAATRIFNALRKLEYRGYDSAGIATISGGKADMRKATGKLDALEAELAASPLSGDTGIGHTRWATHGAATIENCHPHRSGPVRVVHNGIIENHAALRAKLITAGYEFVTDTDTETVAVHIDHLIKDGKSGEEAVRATLEQLEGAFSLGILIEGEEALYAARRGSPLAIGYGEGENYIGSDSIALAGLTNRVTFLDDGDFAVLTRDDVMIYDRLGNRANREVKIVDAGQMVASKGRYRHYMAKETHDQPAVLTYVLAHYLNSARDGIDFEGRDKLDLAGLTRVSLVACGTAYYACLTAKYWIESWARIPADVEIASEFRYREPPLDRSNLVIFVSQSGETADTLAALQYAKSQGTRTVGIVNLEESSIARAVDIVLPLKAGFEISVASTKAFTAQLCVLAILALLIGNERGVLVGGVLVRMIEELTKIPRLISETLAIEPEVKELAHELAGASDLIFLGRGILYPLALEAALKVKEITYIHAEGYPSGELKHGPIALVDANMPIIVFAPKDRLVEKSMANIEEVIARDGKVTLITDQEGAEHAIKGLERRIILPKVPELLSPFIHALPAQLLAYHIAVEKGTDVDQPRNLAKSVTVE